MQLKHRLLMDFSVDSLEGGESQLPLHLPSVSEHPSHPGKLPPRSKCTSSIPTSPTPSSRSALLEAGSLSPWETWMVRKTREDILQQERKKIELEEKRRMEERQRQLLEEKQKKSHEEYLRWAKRKQGRAAKKRVEDAHLTTGKQAERKVPPSDEQLKEQYQAWCLRKLEKEAAVKREEEERQKKETQMVEEKKKRAELAYKSWLERAGRPSPRPSPQARQRLVVPMASPPPSFTNPRPWIGPLDD